MRKQWNLAIIQALADGEIKIEELGRYRHNFKDSNKFSKYLKSHPNHERQLQEQKHEEKEASNLFYKRELEKIDFDRFDGSWMRQWI